MDPQHKIRCKNRKTVEIESQTYKQNQRKQTSSYTILPTGSSGFSDGMGSWDKTGKKKKEDKRKSLERERSLKDKCFTNSALF